MSSERTPLLPTSRSDLPSASQVQSTAEDAAQSVKQASFKLAPALAALKAGKLPSQEQLEKLLDKALDSDVLSPGIGKAGSRTGRLSEEGARVIKALRKVLQAAEQLGHEKNGDDKIQNFLSHLSQVDAPTPARRGHAVEISTSSTATLVSRREQAALAKEVAADSADLLASLKEISLLFLTSPQFRLVINQAVSLFASIVADASGKVSEKAGELESKARETGDDDKPIDYSSAKSKGKKAARGLVSGRIQGQAKEDALIQFENLAHYFEDKVTGDEEVKDKLFEKLNAVVKDVQGKPEYKKSIDTILHIVKKYAGKAQDLAARAADKAADEADQEPLEKALDEGKTILETFANGESLDPTLDAANTLKEDIKADHQVEAYFKDVGSFLEACLKVEGYVTSQRAYRRSSTLFQRGQELVSGNEKYERDLSTFVGNLEGFFGALGEDEAFVELGDAVEELGIELEHAGKTGLNSLKAGSLGLGRDIVDVILPRLVGLVKEIPVPRVEFQSEFVDFVVDDITFESASFVPDNIRVVNHNDLLLTQGFAAYAADFDSSVRLHVDGLRLHAKDIAYWFNKKGSFLTTFEDEGLLEIAFDRKGISFDVTLENATEDNRESFFVVKDVQVDISDLQYHISKNTSWLLYFSKPFVSSVIKRAVKESLQHSIIDYLKQADLALYGLQNRAIAATNAKPSPKDFLSAVFSTSVFSSSSSAKLTQKGIVKYGRRGDYLLAIGADDQIFPDKAISEKRARAKNLLEQASSVAGSASEAVEGGKIKADQVKVDAEREASKLGLTVQKKERVEAGKEGWRSDAFNV